jgi:hypothetical protein
MLVNHPGVIYAPAMRSCAKMGCGEQAEASVAVRYAARTAVVGPLAATHDPNLLDLCDVHAGRLTPPRGWRLLDERREVAVTDGGVEVEIAASA